MPGGDRMGPAGMGPMTGRAAGFCAGYATPGFINPIFGRGGWGSGGGWGRGGGGWGRRNWFYAMGLTGWQRSAYAYPTLDVPYANPYGPVMGREQEMEILRSQAECFQEALDGIAKRIEELETKAKEV